MVQDVPICLAAVKTVGNGIPSMCTADLQSDWTTESILDVIRFSRNVLPVKPLGLSVRATIQVCNGWPMESRILQSRTSRVQDAICIQVSASAEYGLLLMGSRKIETYDE